MKSIKPSQKHRAKGHPNPLTHDLGLISKPNQQGEPSFCHKTKRRGTKLNFMKENGEVGLCKFSYLNML